mmetsp:Transcript_20918/g.41013  ORF Transcript_20918/g.41013 Transcript_20918/m.41013 type:complete len:225 (-) Transcript_20918:2459-3133(-)
MAHSCVHQLGLVELKEASTVSKTIFLRDTVDKRSSTLGAYALRGIKAAKNGKNSLFHVPLSELASIAEPLESLAEHAKSIVRVRVIVGVHHEETAKVVRGTTAICASLFTNALVQEVSGGDLGQHHHGCIILMAPTNLGWQSSCAVVNRNRKRDVSGIHLVPGLDACKDASTCATGRQVSSFTIVNLEAIPEPKQGRANTGLVNFVTTSDNVHGDGLLTEDSGH